MAIHIFHTWNVTHITNFPVIPKDQLISINADTAWNTRIYYKCKICGKTKVKTTKGCWSYSEITGKDKK